MLQKRKLHLSSASQTIWHASSLMVPALCALIRPPCSQHFTIDRSEQAEAIELILNHFARYYQDDIAT